MNLIDNEYELLTTILESRSLDLDNNNSDECKLLNSFYSEADIELKENLNHLTKEQKSYIIDLIISYRYDYCMSMNKAYITDKEEYNLCELIIEKLR